MARYAVVVRYKDGTGWRKEAGSYVEAQKLAVKVMEEPGWKSIAIERIKDC